MTEEEKIKFHKDTIVKYIDRLYGTASVVSEGNYTSNLINEAKKLDIKDLTDLATTLDVFGKCVLHYRMPIEMRLNVSFAKATEVNEEDRIAYWKDYKIKLKAMNKGPEEEYDKIILMACTLHVPIDAGDENSEENVEDKANENSENDIESKIIENSECVL